MATVAVKSRVTGDTGWMSGVRIWVTRYMGWERRFDLYGLCGGGGLGVECGECVPQEGEVLVERDAAPQCAGGRRLE